MGVQISVSVSNTLNNLGLGGRSFEWFVFNEKHYGKKAKRIPNKIQTTDSNSE